MTRRRPCWLGVSVLALCGLPLAHAQETDRSVVVGIDAAGRVQPSGGIAKRYWADPAANTIHRSNLDGSGVEVVVKGLNVPYGLSFDPSSGAFLWTSSGDAVVQKLPASGDGLVTLETDFEDPFAIVQDHGDYKIAYAVLKGELVKITQYDDSEKDEQEVLMAVDPEQVHGLALDPKAGILYVGNINGMMTQRVRLEDNRAETLLYVEEKFPSQPTEEPVK